MNEPMHGKSEDRCVRGLMSLLDSYDLYNQPVVEMSETRPSLHIIAQDIALWNRWACPPEGCENAFYGMTIQERIELLEDLFSNQ